MSDSMEHAAGLPHREIFTSWLGTAADPVVFVDPELRIVESSPAFRELTSKSPGETFVETLDPFTAPMASRLFEGLLANGDCSQELVLHHVQEDHSVPVAYSWTVCRGKDGACLGFLGVGRPAEAPNEDEDAATLRDRIRELESEQERRRQEVVRLKQRLKDQSASDDLTGLGNRRYVLDRLDTEVPRAIRYDEPLTIVLFDIDHFFKVNDRYGQSVGDDVLRQVAAVVREQVRTTDLVARYDGEEFMVLCPHTDRASSHFLAERLRRRIAEMSFESDGEEFGITISTGLVTVAGGNEFDVEAIIHAAEEALQAAKNGGMNRVQLVEAP